jgi:O-antigen/teichoic acid export membrane protein
LLQDRGYLYMVSLVLGLDALADLAAARLFFMPLGLLNLSTTRIAISKGSQLAALHRWREFRTFLFAFTSVLLLVWLLYSAVVLATFHRVVELVLGAKYSSAGSTLALWAVFFGVFTVRRQLCTALGVYKLFKETAGYDIVAALAALISCLVLVLAIGQAGAVVSLIIGEAVAMVLYLRLYLRMGTERVVPAGDLAVSRP